MRSWLCGLLCVVAICAEHASGAEFRLEPLIEFTEEYNSNIFLSDTDEQADYITSLSPVINARYSAPFWDWDLQYAYIERHYAMTDVRPDRTFQVALNNTTRILDDRVGILLRDDYSRVSLTPAYDYTQESTFINQTDTNVFSVNPFIAAGPRERSPITAGYTYRNTWYKEPEAFDTVDHVGSLEARREMTSAVTLNAVFRHGRSTNRLQDYARDELLAGLRYEYADRSTLTATAGVNRFNVHPSGESWQGVWDVRISHRWPSMTTDAATARQFIPDPLRVLRREDSVQGTVTVEEARTTVRLSGGVRRYAGVLSETLESTTTNGTLAVTYALTQEATLSLSGRREHLESFNPYSRSLIAESVMRISGQRASQLTTGLEARYTTSTSHDAAGTVFRVVRVIADLSYRF